MAVDGILFRNYEYIKIADKGWRIDSIVGHVLEISINSEVIHFFHRACIAQQFAHDRTCPLCSARVTNFAAFIEGATEDSSDLLVIANRPGHIGVVQALQEKSYLSTTDRAVAVRVANGLVLNGIFG